ncbi:acyltransferase [Mucilaginibacter sp. Bleaf8]|uniref:acyltransferase family protein n=1 Tax=Mucilaginibacter sp. Bleaf8 TaxID=2834430 RepID=UPI001BD0CC88|nr:acyltransferase [Mucilaginibacter sp. Bleaf8]MBS7563819.1 acyltransferase [Mucilaginibacter sp. Bleaf8]
MTRHIPSLNGLRAISIFIVIIYHLSLGGFISQNGPLNVLSPILFNGALGVNIFFFISGYLITTLLIGEYDRKGHISLGKFYIRRTIRIFPAYYFMLLVYAVLQLCGYFKITGWEWLSAVGYVRQFYQEGTSELGHLWSLSVEELFYLFWPFIFIKAGKNRSLITIILIAITALYRIFSYEFPPSFYLHHTIFYSADALLIGCLFALHNEKIKTFVQRWKYPVLFFGGTLVFSLYLEKYTYHLMSDLMRAHQTNTKIFAFSAIVHGLFGSLGSISIGLIGLVVVSSIYNKGIWFTILNAKIMDYIGKLSYSFYLWQQLFTADRRYLHQFPIIVILLFIIIAAHISFYIIEQPFLKLKQRFSA